jgi:hypothetical protein
MIFSVLIATVTLPLLAAYVSERSVNMREARRGG